MGTLPLTTNSPRGQYGALTRESDDFPVIMSTDQSFTTSWRWIPRHWLRPITPILRLIPGCLTVLLLWNLPYPSTLSSTGTRLLSVYAGIIVALMTSPYELSVIVAAALTFLTLTQNFQCQTTDSLLIPCGQCGHPLPPSGNPGGDSFSSPSVVYQCQGMEGAFRIAISGFSHKLTWLVFSAFHIGHAVQLTGLGQRIGRLLLRTMGGSVLGIGYALCLAECCLAPFVPSNTARGGGIVYPIVLSMAQSLQIAPDGPHAATGRFLMFLGAQANLVSSSLFMTGMAGNPLMVDKAREVFGIEWNFSHWFLGNLVPAGVIMAALPLLAYILFQPRLSPDIIHQTVKCPDHRDPPWSVAEIKLVVVLAGALALWISASFTQMDSTVVAFMAFTALLAIGVLTWKNVLENQTAWDTFFWLGSFIMMAEQLNALKVSAWLGQSVAQQLTGLSPRSSLWALTLIYTGTMYLFSSTTSHILALGSPLLMAARALQCPPLPMVALISYFSALGAVVLAAQVPGSDFDYKVLLLKRRNTRNFDQTFAFPGGNLDPEDASPHWSRPLVSYLPHTVNESTLSYRIGALRELYEECGLLFAHHHSSETVTHCPGDSQSDWASSNQLVRSHSAATEDFIKHCTTQQCYPLVHALLPMSRWITPIHYPRRFDTHFFLLPYSAYTANHRPVSADNSSTAELPSDQTFLPPVQINPQECSEYQWLTPAEALVQYQDQRLHLFPPQWYLLNDMARFHRLSDLVAHTQVQPVVPFLPKFTKLSNQKTVSLLPGDILHPYSAYATSLPSIPESPTDSSPTTVGVHWEEHFSVETLDPRPSHPHHRLQFEMVDGKMLNFRLEKDLIFTSIGVK
ncbi:hypothetical protein IWQ61_006962 [Dispira simplex]|nr:hypothetical protein IWQ61_006962 [Dispira simplex]